MPGNVFVKKNRCFFGTKWLNLLSDFQPYVPVGGGGGGHVLPEILGAPSPAPRCRPPKKNEKKLNLKNPEQYTLGNGLGSSKRVQSRTNRNQRFAKFSQISQFSQILQK